MSDLEAAPTTENEAQRDELLTAIGNVIRAEYAYADPFDDGYRPEALTLARAVFLLVERFVSSLPQDPNQKYAAMETSIRALADVFEREAARSASGSVTQYAAQRLRALLETP